MEAMTSTRIVLLGKTGVGKSSLANTMLGEECFPPSHFASSGTRTCQDETKCVNGRTLTLIDTPGFFDTEVPEDHMKAGLISCITQCAPGPHAFLILLKVERFTKHEEDLFKQICQQFSQEALKYSQVVFTHGDQLPEGQEIGDFVHQNEALRNLVMKCGGRCHVVDNKYWKNGEEGSYRSNGFQVEEILKTVDEVIKANNGGCYTNEMLQCVQAQIQDEERIMAGASVQVPRKEIRRRAARKVFDVLLIRLAGVGFGMLFGAFLGVLDQFTAAQGLKNVSNLALTDSGRSLLGKAALMGMLRGIGKGYQAVEDAESVGEAISKVMDRACEQSSTFSKP